MTTIMLDAHLIGLGPFAPDMSRDGFVKAREVWVRYQTVNGMAGSARLIGQNGKLAKGKGITAGLTLSPASLSGRFQTCLHRTVACEAACVMDSGNSRFSNVRHSRAVKTGFLADHPTEFVTLLAHEAIGRRFNGKRVKALRLNVASDLRWELFAPALLDVLFKAGIRAYDYSKYPAPARQFAPDGYTIVMSHHGRNLPKCLDYLQAGGNVAVVFASPKHRLPATWHGFQVIDGDLHDDRTRDGSGVVVGLAGKGDLRGARGTAAGFLQDPTANL